MMTTAGSPQKAERNSRLFRDVLAGDRDALDELIVQCTPMLWRVARSTGLDAASCADVVQQTWLTLLGHLDRVRAPEALIAWLVTVTRREAVHLATAQSRTRPAATETFEPLTDDSPPVEHALLADERQRVLWRAVNQLPPRCVQLIQVIAFHDRADYAAIAAALGMPKGSIGPTRGRCLAKLRALLSGQPDWSQP
ncbi:RNA polymerase sigma factor [Actinoplanes sp. CA-030573]|uniref:RNA polymerase sigma factor n=1 Tax=Actinoplanes sp. CA-030573 TaxID=3239898 RepID=UPI003D8D0029